MTKQTEPWIDSAYSAVDALRLFVNVAARDTTTYESAIGDEESSHSEVIKFSSVGGRGTIERSEEGLTLTIFPNMTTAPDFVPRKLVFHRKTFESSMIISTPTEKYLANGGRDFAVAFATLLSARHPKFRFEPLSHTLRHLLATNAVDGADDVRETMQALAQDLDISLAGHLKCLISHPALDMPADCSLVDDAGTIHAPTGEAARKMAALEKTARFLPTILRFTQTGTDYPLEFLIMPHRFTLERAQDPSLARTRGILANARAAVMTGETGLGRRYRLAIEVPATEGQTDLAGATSEFLSDWEAVIGDADLPDIIQHTETGVSTETRRVLIELIVIAQPAAAEKYNEHGKFEMVPS